MERTKVVKYKKNISNVFTLGNMTAGLLSILLLFYDDGLFLAACGLILLGGVFDFFDGFFARKLNAVTDLGKQLDSFADIVTFGIAPLVLFNWLYSSVWTIVPSLVFLVAGAYRLARYNLGDFSQHFIGLPITAAGIILTIVCTLQLLWMPDHGTFAGAIVTIALIILLSIAMVSKKKIKRLISTKGDLES